jgi:hypothetical protein
MPQTILLLPHVFMAQGTETTLHYQLYHDCQHIASIANKITQHKWLAWNKENNLFQLINNINTICHTIILSSSSLILIGSFHKIILDCKCTDHSLPPASCKVNSTKHFASMSPTLHMIRHWKQAQHCHYFYYNRKFTETIINSWSNKTYFNS